MKNSRIFSARQVVRFLALLVCLALAGPAFAQLPETVQSFRGKYSGILNRYEEVLQRMGSAKGLKLVNDARRSIEDVTDNQLAAVFAKSGVADLSEMARTLDIVASLASSAKPDQLTLAGAASVGTTSVGFPNAPPIFADCNNIEHGVSFRFGFLVALQVVQSILRAAQFVCEEVIAGFNAAAVCVAFAIAVDVATIPFELAEFCAGEEDGALLQGSYDRLEHIHNDLDDARSAIISNANTNTTSIINNDNSNRTSIINNDNANRTLIINNDIANKNAIVSELQALGSKIVRLLNTPEGQRASSILACTGQPGFPYAFPVKK